MVGASDRTTVAQWELGLRASDPAVPQPPLLMRAWEELTVVLLAG